jgi:hypothetical protein
MVNNATDIGFHSGTRVGSASSPSLPYGYPGRPDVTVSAITRTSGGVRVWPPTPPVRYAVVALRGVWRSLVARFVRDEEVVGSNPATPTRVVAGERP